MSGATAIAAAHEGASALPELPEDWEWASLESVTGEDGLFTDGDWVLREDLETGQEVRLLQLGDIGRGAFLDKSSKWISAARAVELNCTDVRPGDLLISRMAEPIARACVVPELGVATHDVVPSSTSRAAGGLWPREP